jgi:phosphatidylinositol-3-phosphatase
MHGTNDCPDATTNVRVADAYASDLVDSIMSSAAWRDGLTAIVVAWDEGTDATGCCDADPGGGQIYTSVITNRGPRGLTYTTQSNHYSMLATLQHMWHLGCLPNARDTAYVVPASRLVSVN